MPCDPDGICHPALLPVPDRSALASKAAPISKKWPPARAGVLAGPVSGAEGGKLVDFAARGRADLQGQLR